LVTAVTLRNSDGIADMRDEARRLPPFLKPSLQNRMDELLLAEK